MRKTRKMADRKCQNCGSTLKNHSGKDNEIFWTCSTHGCGYNYRECGNAINRFSNANGTIPIRMSRSLHEALLIEADNEGVSLNQLCITKLSTQLKTFILGEENA